MSVHVVININKKKAKYSIKREKKSSSFTVRKFALKGKVGQGETSFQQCVTITEQDGFGRRRKERRWVGP